MSEIIIRPGWREIQAASAAGAYRKLREIKRAQINAAAALPAYYGPSLWQNIYSSVQETYPGGWQQNATPTQRLSLLAFSAIYSCVTGISSDIAKCRMKLMQETADPDITTEITSGSPWLPLLRRPNHYQIWIQFAAQWIVSKLLYGNAYIAKERDARGVVRAMYVLDACRVVPLVADNGDVFYQLSADPLSKIREEMTLPAEEIIHDLMPALFHPLIGTPPLFACALSAQMGNSIQNNSTAFFGNRSLPGGMLTAPGKITNETAARMKETFETNFSGENLGRLLVAGDGLDFKPFTMTAEQSLLVEQLKWSVSDVARAFHYPEYKLGGPLPPYQANMEALTLAYYTDCLQTQIESMENCLDDGLEIPAGQEFEIDLENLLRMDTQGKAETVTKLVGGAVYTPDDGRKKFNKPPVPGGNSVYLQQQNYSLAALAKRDAGPDPFAKSGPAAPASAEPVQDIPLAAADLTDEEIDAQAALILGQELTPF